MIVKWGLRPRSFFSGNIFSNFRDSISAVYALRSLENLSWKRKKQSHLTLRIPAYRRSGWRETWPGSPRESPQTPLCHSLPLFGYHAICLQNITTNEAECQRADPDRRPEQLSWKRVAAQQAGFICPVMVDPFHTACPRQALLSCELMAVPSSGI